MQLLAGEGQEGRQQHLERIDRAQGGVDRCGWQRPCRVLISNQGAAVSRYLLTSVARRMASASAARRRTASRCSPTVWKPGLDRRQDLLIRRAQLAGLGHHAIPMLVGKGQHPVGQVAPGGDQLVVVAVDEIIPIPIGVLALGHIGGQVVAQRIRVVAGEEIQPPHRPIAAAGDFLAFQVHELVGGHIVGQGQPVCQPCLSKSLPNALARADQLGRPDHGMEGDVVLADEVIGARLRVVPPVVPGVRVCR